MEEDLEYYEDFSEEGVIYNKYFLPDSLFVYHYLGQKSLQSIIENQTLRLTDSRFLNDSSEASRSFTVLERILKDESEAIGGNSVASSVLFSISEEVEKFKNEPVWVICFSTKADDLNQWRSYASPGAGYSLGFKTQDLESLASHYGGVLAKCIYDQEEQSRMIIESLEEAIRDLEGYFPFFKPGEINYDLVSSRVDNFLSFFFEIAPLFKNSAFEDESEIRLVISEDKKLNHGFRNGSTTIIPYIEIEMEGSDGEPIFPSRVIIKTSNTSELTKLGLERFLLAKNLLIEDLYVSNIPYRESI